MIPRLVSAISGRFVIEHYTDELAINFGHPPQSGAALVAYLAPKHCASLDAAVALQSPELRRAGIEMSFGFSISDFLAAFELATKLRDKWIDAPKEYKSIKEETKHVENILRDIGQLGNRIDLDQQQETDLKQACQSCREVLGECEKLVNKYSAIQKDKSGRSTVRRTWTRLKADPDDIRHLRDGLSAQITQLGLLHDVIETNIVIDVHEGVEDLQLNDLQRERSAVADWYSPTDFANQQMDQLSQRENGTGSWFLASDKYKHWKQHGNCTLLCPGIPGSGKSVMVATIIEDLQACFETNTDIAIIYIYCKFNRQAEQSLHSMLAMLVRQLFQERAQLPDTVMKLYQKHRDRATRPSVEELKILLRVLVALYRQVFIVIDALDECANVDHQRDNLLDDLFSLQRSGGNDTNILATTRVIPDIVQQFLGHPQIEIRADEGDIEAYLTSRMRNVPKFVLQDIQLQEEIKNRIATAAQGMFLLAKLQFDSLRDKTNRGYMRDALAQLGEGSDALNNEYAKTIHRIDLQLPGWRDLARRVLLWIVYAKRQLSIDELREAIAIDPQRPNLDLHDYLDDADQIVSVCHGLVEIDQESQVVRLVHYTTQEYFEKIRNQWLPGGHIRITQSCIAYLSMDELLHSQCRWKTDMSAAVERHKLLVYAGKNWGLHAQGIRDRELISDITNFLSNPAYARLSAKITFGSFFESGALFMCSSSDVSATHISCHFGLFHVLENLIKRGESLDDKDQELRTPLHYLVSKGYKEMIQLLLARSCIELNNTDFWGLTPLGEAARNGQREIIELLLSQPGIKVNQGHALAEAASGGHMEIVQLPLRQPSVDVNSKRLYGNAPLAEAVRRGDTDIVQLLLSHSDIEVNCRYIGNQTPLAKAAEYEYSEVVQLLLNHPSLEVNSSDRWGNTALIRAAQTGNVKIIKLILSHPNININCRNETGDTPLTEATQRGYIEIVQLLLSHPGIEVNCKYKDSHTSLAEAAEKQYKEVVRLLLNLPSIEVHSSNISDTTSLIRAAQTGDVKIVKLLLSSPNINVNCRNAVGSTALAEAAQRGCTEIVQLLLSHPGIEVNYRDRYGYTSLTRAASYGQIEVCNVLLAHPGIEVSAKDKRDHAPLFEATEKGRMENTTLLVNHQ